MLVIIWGFFRRLFDYKWSGVEFGLVKRVLGKGIEMLVGGI